jgi:hypothetical protein
MSEPDVTLTDYLIAIECLLFCYLLWKQKISGQLSTSFIVFFLSLSVAAIAGGTVHGFCNNEYDQWSRILWFITMAAIGIASFSAWLAAIKLKFADKTAKVLTNIGLAGIILYFIIITFISQAFLIGIIVYVPALIFLLFVLFSIYQTSQHRNVKLGIYGIVLTFISSFIQQAQVGLHPIYFNHNALYHLIQFIALLLLFLAVSWILKPQILIEGEKNG